MGKGRSDGEFVGVGSNLEDWGVVRIFNCVGERGFQSNPDRQSGPG